MLALESVPCSPVRARLERVIRELVTLRDYAKVETILDQLCNEYAYAVHQPHARNGGLIGLAAAAIALGQVSWSSALPFCVASPAMGQAVSPR